MNEHPHPLPLDAALERWSQEPVPAEVVARLRGSLEQFRERLEAAPPLSTSPVATPARRFGRLVPAIAGGALAAALLVAALLTFGPRDAWAQVAKNLHAKTWVRWTLQIPPDLPEDQIPADVRKQPPVIWLSLQKKVAASRFLESVYYVDLGQQELYRYEPPKETVYRASTSDHDAAFFEQAGTLLRLASQGSPDLKLPETASLKLLERTQREVHEEGRTWVDFTFRLEDSRRNPPEYLTTIRVDAETRLPARMIEQLTAGDKPVVRTFVFDYPETGPADVYALGVPRTAKVVDVRLPGGAKEIAAAHAKGRLKPMDHYTAIGLMTHPKTGWRDIMTAHRIEFDGSTYRLAWADLMALLEFRQKLWKKEIAIPDDADPAEWWKEAVKKLPFEPTQDLGPSSGHQGFPDHVGYYWLGDLGLSTTPILVDRRPTNGPPDCVFLKIDGTPSNSYWFSPEHDYMAMRFEVPVTDDAEWKLQTTVIDKVAKSPGGRWYALQSRVGRIRHSGEDPPDEQGTSPIMTSVYRYFIDFE